MGCGRPSAPSVTKGIPRPSSGARSRWDSRSRRSAGSAGRPFFGIRPQMVDAEGGVLDDEQSGGAAEGNLCNTHSSTGQARTIYGDHARYAETYYSTYKGT